MLIDHNILIDVLWKRFGVRHHELNWFQSYHSGRSQTFIVSDDKFGPVALTCSVPQGSVIGPKEFVAYTEDIVETIDRFAVNNHLYADDSQLLTHMHLEAAAEHRHRLELCVEQLRDWCSSRRLQLNPNKTKLIWFGSRAILAMLRQLDTNLSLCSVVVKPVDSVPDLGLILDSELSMAQHIGKISSTCFSTSGGFVNYGWYLTRHRCSGSYRRSLCRILTTVTPF